MATYTVTTGNDVTQYTVSTGARGPAGPGGVGTTEEVLGLLQGTAGDTTRIGAEYMPNILELEQIRLGEVPAAVLPVGTLTRVGTSLRIHDNATEGGVPVVAPATSDPSVFVGFKKSLPFGTGGSTVKQAGSQYYDEVGRITLPGDQTYDGMTLHIWAWTRIKSDITPGGLNRVFYLIPAYDWDYDPQTFYWGATPTNTRYSSSASSAVPNWRPLATSSLESEMVFSRTHLISHSGSQITMANADAGTYGRGYDETAAARFAATDVVGMPGGLSHTQGNDLEFVVVCETDLAATRTIDCHIKISAR